MNKLYFIKNPEVFQGEKYLNNNKNYFEGWYFKNSNEEESISFIPGINIDEKSKNAFIQVITNNSSYFINYNILDFKFNTNPFFIKIGKNFFSKEKIHIEIEDKSQNLKIYGNLKYSNNKNIKTNFINPNIMGPFSYIPFMECNHAILSMKNNINGTIAINNKKINFNNGIGYIEKDWGCSFPKSYIWSQGNDFENQNASFMLSIANIPFKMFEFTGLICVLIIDNKEYKFTTYNNSKIIKYKVEPNFIDIIIKKSSYLLEIKSQNDEANKLTAPVKGKMNKEILESISAKIKITLMKNNNIIFSDISKNSGLEIVL